MGAVDGHPPALRDLPMFPLSTVLFPTGRLPLHVFEARYRAMVRACAADDRRFGVVLIARGSEVGGGDERLDTGTVATIVALSETRDGRFGLVVTGHRRLRVCRWLPEEDYPKAEVAVLPPVPPVDPGEPFPDEPLALEIARATQEVRSIRALWSELGQGPALAGDLELGESEEEQVWRLCSLAPLGPLDRQRLLEAESLLGRLRLLIDLVGSLRGDYLALLNEPSH